MKKIIWLYLPILFSMRAWGQTSPNSQDTLILNNALAKVTYLMQNRDYDGAILEGEKAKKTANQTLGDDKSNWLQHNKSNYYLVCSYLGQAYAWVGNIKSAIANLEEAKPFQQFVFGIESVAYSNCLKFLAELYQEDLDFGKADTLFSNIISNCIPKNFIDSTYFAAYFSDYSVLCRKIASYNRAEELGLIALKIKKDLYPDGKNREYTVQLDNLSTLYLQLGNNTEAEKYLQQSLELKKQTVGDTSVDYYHTLSILGLLNYYWSNYYKAEQIQLKVLNSYMHNNVVGSEFEMPLARLSMIYRDQGRFDACEKINEQFLEHVKRRVSESHPDYAEAARIVGDYYSEAGLLDKAFLYYKKSSDIYKESLGENSPEYGGTLMDLGKCYSISGDCNKAIAYQEKALSVIKKQNVINKHELVTCLQNLACEYGGCLKNYYKADSLFTIAYSIEKGANGHVQPKLLTNMAANYRCMGNPRKAILYFMDAKTKIAETSGSNSNDYEYNLFGLINAYLQDNYYDYAEPLIREYNILVNKKIKNFLSFLSEREKLKMILNMDYWQQFFNNYLIKKYDLKPQLAAISFNNELHFKSCILSNSLLLRKIIENSDDSNLINNYNELKTIRTRLFKALSAGKQSYSEDVVKLQNRCEQLEKLLLSSIPRSKSRLFEASISVDSVKKSLGNDEACIELFKVGEYTVPPTGISQINIGDKDSYYALLTRKGWANPKLIYLFKQYEIDSILEAVRPKNSDSVYIGKSSPLKTLLWHPVESELAGARKIFIAPAGAINAINISAIPYNEEMTTGEKYKIHILGTTADAIRYSPTYLNAAVVKQAIIFGGIDYDNANQAPLNKAVVEENNIGFYQVAEIASRSAMAKFGYLPGTMKEGNNIQEICRDHHLSTISFTGENATEASFKQLNSKKEPFILHIATHGYFFPDPQQTNQEKSLQIFSSEKKNVFKWSDDPLLRSGLIFAGANKTWGKAEYVSDSTEDGILTSYEISNLDLSNCQLVVLSACETGLGDIKGSEGVFGLQRAFKMAGVKNIIMSLWKVPDKETQELMTLFYNYCFAGKSVHDALQAAQTDMRKKGYAPYYWAAFKLLE